MKYFFILLLYFIGNNITIKLVGDIALSDIFVAIFFVFYLFQRFFFNLLKKDNDICNISKLYILLFLIQIIAEIFVGNEVKNVLRGLSVTILSLMKFVFFWYLFTKYPKNIFYAFLCMLLVSIFSAQNVDGVTEEDILEGSSQEAFTFFKFKIAPMIGLGLAVLSLFIKGKITGNLFIAAGLLCVVLGARSTGLMITLTGILAFLFLNKVRLNKTKIYIYGICCSLLCYMLFVIYINAVLSGDIVSGNSAAQVKNLENPYNPISFLLSGRTESPGSIAAISDSPIIGWGAWAEDPNLKYTRIKLAFQGDIISYRDYYGEEIYIPGHSVLLQTGVNNGVLAMIIMGLILYFFIHKGFVSLNNKNRYLFLTLYCIMQLIWNGLFSPLSHFRGLFPLYFAICLYSYKINYYEKNFSSNRNIR